MRKYRRAPQQIYRVPSGLVLLSRYDLFAFVMLLVALFVWQGERTALPQAAITRTAKGTAQGKGTANLTLGSVTIASGATIVVAVASEFGVVATTGVTWNGISLTMDLAANSNAAETNQDIWSKHGVAGGTGTVSVTQNNSGALAFSVIELAPSAGNVIVTDRTAGAGATVAGTSPSSGATSTTTTANEMLIGVVTTNGPNGDTAGSWSNGFSAGQRLGSTGGSGPSNQTVSDGFLAVSSTGTYTAAKTGITSRFWAAGIVTYKETASGGGGGLPFFMQQVPLTGGFDQKG